MTIDFGHILQIATAAQNVCSQPANACQVGEHANKVANNATAANIGRQFFGHGHEVMLSRRRKKYRSQHHSEESSQAKERTHPASRIGFPNRAHRRPRPHNGCDRCSQGEKKRQASSAKKKLIARLISSRDPRPKQREADNVNPKTSEKQRWRHKSFLWKEAKGGTVHSCCVDTLYREQHRSKSLSWRILSPQGFFCDRRGFTCSRCQVVNFSGRRPTQP